MAGVYLYWLEDSKDWGRKPCHGSPPNQASPQTQMLHGVIELSEFVDSLKNIVFLRKKMPDPVTKCSDVFPTKI